MAEEIVLEFAKIEREAMRRLADKVAAQQLGEVWEAHAFYSTQGQRKETHHG